jgi:hypothetical protein
MIRTQIQLTPEQSRRLKRIAKQRGISMAEAIRRSIDSALASGDIPDRDEIRARARTAFGQYADANRDISENHDRYLPEAFSE